MTHTHELYGFFLGGDPRRFTPDQENPPEEKERHAAACRAWDDEKTEAETPASEPACQMVPGVGHVNFGTFGLGVNRYDCDDQDCEDAP